MYKIIYQLLESDDNFIIQILDEDRKIIKDYEILIKNKINLYINAIKNNDFIISWDKEDKNKIILDETLLELLLNDRNENESFVNENFEEIRYKKTNEVFLNIKESLINKDEVLSTIEVDEIEFNKKEVIGKYLYHNKIFYELSVVENKFYEIEDLFIKIQKYELESFLTLVLKNYKNIGIRYEDYETIEKECKESIPQLIIEKISVDKSLYIKVNSIISTMDYDFFLENNIKKIVTINEITKEVHISNINIKEITNDFEEIVKILQKLQKKLNKKSMYYLDKDRFLILNEELAKEFVRTELLELTTKYNIIGTDRLKKYNIKAIKPKIIGKFSYDIDYFEGNVEVEIEGEKFSIQSFLENYTKNNYITLSDGANALINKKYIEKLQRIFKNDEKGNIKISFFDLPIIEELIEEKIFSEDFIEKKDFFKGINTINEYTKRMPLINANLRDYQKYGYKWLKYLIDNNLGACLADDMGLGKTLQAITLLSKIHEKKKKKSIVIMPKSLIYNWESEILKFASHLKMGVYYGTNRSLEIFEQFDVILTTYGTVRNDIKDLMKIKFDILILDESQNIKNINSQTTKAVILLNSVHRIALSGTPIENNLLELYSLFRFLNPSMFGTPQEFTNNYIFPIQKYGDMEVLKELKKKIYPFILRRIKREVLKDLPEKIEKVIYVDMNKEHRRYYEERRNYYYETLYKNIKNNGLEKSKFFVLQALNELRHITSSPEVKNKKISSSKKEILIDNVKEAIDNGHKVLIFVNYLSSINSICNSLEKNNIKFLKMTGKTKERKEIVDKFQNNNRYKVFVMTLKTGGIGLNLTSADTIFIYDPWWNKTVENQAVDRAYRMGQDKTVFSYKLILKNSIEEKILKLQEIKGKLLDDLIIEDNLSTKSLSEKDIEFILGK